MSIISDVAEDQTDRTNDLSMQVSLNRPWLNTSGSVIGNRRYDFAYLIENFGHRHVDVEFYPDGKREKAFNYQSMLFADYLNQVRNDPSCRKHLYLAEMPIQSTFPALADEIQTPAFLLEQPNLRPRIFVGFDTVTTGHYHRMRTQAILAPIHGAKTAVLFPPESNRHLRLNPWYALRSNHSRIPFGPQGLDALLDDYPELRKVEPMSFVVEPGQWLFIPDHWTHYVFSKGESVSVTWFWDGGPEIGYAPGIRRDKIAKTSTRVIQSVASGAKKVGLLGPCARLASWLGIIDADERKTLLEYVGSTGIELPSQRKS